MSDLVNELSIPRALRIFQRKRIPANCLASDAVGDCAYITGPKVGQRYQVTKALPDSIATMPAIGVIYQKTSATECSIQVFGEVIGLYSGFTPGEPLFVGALGVPSHAAGTIAQVIGVALSSNIAFLSPEYGGGVGNFRNNQLLVSTGDPRVWLTSAVFLHQPGAVSIDVFHNGRALVQASSSSANDGEYFVAESSPGAGFNEVHITTFTPTTSSRLSASFYVA